MASTSSSNRAPNPRLQRTRSAPLRSPLNFKPFGDTLVRRVSSVAVRVFVASLALAGANGCVNVLHTYFGPVTAKLHLDAADPGSLTVRVRLEDGRVFKPDADGRVVAEIPRFGRTCSVYFLLIPIRDESPNHLAIIEIMAGDSVIRRLSLHDLSRLEKDRDDYWIVDLRTRG